MARFSSVNQLSPAGTVVAVGTSFSNSINCEAARDARVFVDVTAVGAGANLESRLQISHDNTNWADSGALNDMASVSQQVLLLEEFRLSKFARLKYVVTGNSVTLGATIEKKHGV